MLLASNRNVGSTITRRLSTMMQAVRVHEHGDASTLRAEELPRPKPGPGQALVRNGVAGLNFIDTYHRSGLYKRPTPFVLGVEGAGVVEALGEGVQAASDGVSLGERVAYYSPGSYSEYSVVPVEQLLPVPDAVPLAEAAALMTQGMTAHYLVHSCPNASLKGEWVLAHAAGGGTGQLVVQMASQMGARVIGTSSASKLALGSAAGAEVMIDYRTEGCDLVSQVRELTGGAGVRCVWDGVGADTWEKSLDCLGPRGLCVFFGNASGPVPPIDPLMLNAKGSVFITRPKLNDYIGTREELEWRARDVFEGVAQGKLTVRIDQRFPLSRAAEAHTFIESGATTGKVIIDIDPDVS